MEKILNNFFRPIENNNEDIDFKYELYRKGIHFSSLMIPLLYFFLPTVYGYFILGAMASVSLILDFSRYFSPTMNKWLSVVFGKMLRTHELDTRKKNLSGATYLILAALTCVVIFPKFVAIHSLAIFILGDLIAALIGRKFGRYHFLKKSLEGTFAFFVTGIILTLILPKLLYSPYEYLICVAAAFVGSIVENVSKGIADDNFSVPIATGLTIMALYHVVFPNLELVYQNMPK